MECEINKKNDTCTREEKDHKPEIIMQNNATKSEVDIPDKREREYNGTRSTRR